MRDDFAVGLAGKRDAFFLQFVLDLEIVFDDAVMHDGETGIITDERVRIPVGGTAVRRPTGMPDGEMTGYGGFAQLFFEVGDTPLGLHEIELLPRPNGDTAAVVSAVLQVF